MENMFFSGNLAETPFSFLLFRIWNSNKSGLLKIQREHQTKNIAFQRGSIAIDKTSFNEISFLDFLTEKKLIPLSSKKKCENHSQKKQCSIIRSFIELSFLDPAKLWSFIKEFFNVEYLPCFDWPEGEYTFDPESIPQETDILLRIPTMGFIWQGTRQMQNESIIQNFLPQETDMIQVLSPHYIEHIQLELPENYLLNLMRQQKNLKTLYALSELGIKETQKIIFGFISSGIAGPSQSKAMEVSPEHLSQVDITKFFKAFNDKCSFIFKYISKEIGPVAMNVLEKTIDDIRPHLPPVFQKMQIGPFGKIEMNSPLFKGETTFSNSDIRKDLLEGFNEILVAEVLAVKKTLGNGHEAILVKNLENIGE